VARRLAVPIALLAVCAGAPAASASLAGFRSPSGNVGCYISGKGARCDIRNHDWQAPPKPPSCELDWGGGLAVGRHGRADYVCAGDATLDPSSPVLGKGEKIERGRFRCKNKRSGIKCVNRRNEHGFRISAQRAKLF
jgi:hypothetical protein